MNAWLPMLESKFVPNEWNMLNAIIIKIDAHSNKAEILFWFFVSQANPDTNTLLSFYTKIRRWIVPFGLLSNTFGYEHNNI